MLSLVLLMNIMASWLEATWFTPPISLSLADKSRPSPSLTLLFEDRVSETFIDRSRVLFELDRKLGSLVRFNSSWALTKLAKERRLPLGEEDDDGVSSLLTFSMFIWLS